LQPLTCGAIDTFVISKRPGVVIGSLGGSEFGRATGAGARGLSSAFSHQLRLRFSARCHQFEAPRQALLDLVTIALCQAEAVRVKRAAQFKTARFCAESGGKGKPPAVRQHD